MEDSGDQRDEGADDDRRVLADELENTTIRVNTINPGATRTSMRRRAYPAEDVNTLTTPEAITAPYLYLLGPDSRDVSGRYFECQPKTRSR